MDTPSPEDIAHSLASLANSYDSTGIKRAVDILASEHPSLQQQITGGFVLNFVKLMAKKYIDKSYDKRNEAACHICWKMWNCIRTTEPGFDDNDTWVKLPLV